MKNRIFALVRLPIRVWPNLTRDLLLNKILASVLVPDVIRWRLLRAYGLDVQKSRLCPNIWFGNKNISIGTGTFVNYGCRFNTAGRILIGRSCDIGPRVMFITSSHLLGKSSRRAGHATSEGIVVGDGVWIGAGAIVLPGVTIGNGCIIAAGAVVKDNCTENTLYAGNPAAAKKTLP